jgi:hypothetical protein
MSDLSEPYDPQELLRYLEEDVRPDQMCLFTRVGGIHFLLSQDESTQSGVAKVGWLVVV